MIFVAMLASGYRNTTSAPKPGSIEAMPAATKPGTRLLLLDEPFEGIAPVLARRLAELKT
jgi:hypothetical protein